MKISGVVIGVDTQSGISKKTGKPYTKFTIQWSNGVGYDTFNATISGLATKLQGQPVEAYVRTTQNGGFTNNDILAIAPEGELPAEEENTQTAFTPQNNFQTNGSGGDDKRRTKEQIARESALIAAFSMPNPNTANDTYTIEDRLDLARRLYSIAMDGFSPTPTTPEEVASTVPNVTTGADQNW